MSVDHEKTVRAVAYLRAMADELEQGRAGLMLYESIGIIAPDGDADTCVVAMHATLSWPPPARSVAHVEALRGALRALLERPPP